MKKVKKNNKKTNKENDVSIISWVNLFKFKNLDKNYTPILAFSWILIFWALHYLRSHYLYPINLFIDNLPDIFLFKAPRLFYSIKAVLLVIWFAAIGLGIGVFILDKFRMKLNNKFELFSTSLALGWGIFGIFMMILALFRLWYPKFIFSLLIVITPGAIYYLYNALKQKYEKMQKITFSEKFTIIVLSIISLLYLFISLSPDIFYDALVYHFAIPNYYWLHNSAIPLNSIFSGFPLLIQMLYSPFILLNMEECVHIVNWVFVNFTVIACIGFSLRLTKKMLPGLLGGLLFFSSVSVFSLIYNGNTEIGWSFLQITTIQAFSLIFQYREKHLRDKFIILSGVLTGITVGVKYQPWPTIAILPFVLLYFSYRFYVVENKQNEETVSKVGILKNAFKDTLLFMVIVGIFSIIWPIKNIIFFKNPIYPFLTNVFSKEPHVNAEKFLSVTPTYTFTTIKGLINYILHPFTNVSKATGKAANDLVGPVPVFVLFMLFFVKIKSESLKVFRVILFVSWVMWSISSTVTRYFLPTLPLITLYFSITSLGLFKKYFRNILIILLLIACFFNLKFSLLYCKSYNMYNVILGRMSKHEFLSNGNINYPPSNFEAVDFINKNTTKDAKILLLADARTSYLKRDYLAATTWDHYPLNSWILESNNVEELYKKYKENGVTHQVINDIELGRLHSLKRMPILPFDDEKKMKLFKDFNNKHLKLIFNKFEKNKKGQISKNLKVYEVVRGQ